ncbi:MAG: YfhO family protein, partial [Acidobacteriota bacterium]|nr:YfhO family protein [Acidobacteriota bacterium]
PLLGQMQPGLSYPFNWMLFALPLRHGWIRQVYLHWYFVLIHYMGGLFCYWLCRDLRRTIRASLFAGAAFGVGGFVGTTDWPMMLNGAVWAPLVFLFFLRVLRGESPLRNSAFAGTCLGIAFLSGHHQIPIFITLAISGSWIYLLMYFKNSSRTGLALRCMGTFGLFLGFVSAFLMLPALEYGKLAIRWVGAANTVGWADVVPYPVHANFSLIPTTLLGIVIPGVNVNTNPYVGWAVLSLALIGLVRNWERREIRVLATVAIGGLLFSLAHFDVFHGILYSLVPLVEKARSASMAEFIFHFGLIVLTAYGIDDLLDPQFRLVHWLPRVISLLLTVAGVFAVLVLILLSFQLTKGLDANNLMMAAFTATLVAAAFYAWKASQISTRSVGVLLFLLMLLESGLVTGYGYRNREQPEYLLNKMARNVDIVSFLQGQPGAVRVEVDDQALPFNFGDWYGIDQFGGYLASLTINVADIQGNYWGRMLFATNFWIGTKPARDGQIELYTGASGLKVYANPDAFPRVWSVHRAVAVAASQVGNKLQAGGGALRQETFLLESPPKLDVCGGTDNVTLLSREPDRISIEADLGCKGMVIAAETYFPGWKATVDGRPEKVWEAYSALRGVVVGAGKHRIEMVYRPTSVIVGGTMTILGLLGVLGLAVGRPRRILD